jgi:hypothetical protein
MSRPRWTPGFLLALSVAGLLAAPAACDDPPGSGDETGPDAYVVRNDVGPCGPQPAVFCLPGAIGKACGEPSVLMTCDGKFWQCPAGTVVPTDCGCRTGGGDGGATLDAGAACPTTDAGRDAHDARDAMDADDG